MINLESITLIRDKSRLINSVKRFGPKLLSVFILIGLLLVLVALKANVTRVGLELADLKEERNTLNIKNQKLKTDKSKLQSHERIKSIALSYGMKFPGQQDLIRAKND